MQRIGITGPDISTVLAGERINEHVPSAESVRHGHVRGNGQERPLLQPGTAGWRRFTRKEMSPDDAQLHMGQGPDGGSGHEVAEAKVR
jgi:hypothetical protein